MCKGYSNEFKQEVMPIVEATDKAISELERDVNQARGLSISGYTQNLRYLFVNFQRSFWVLQYVKPHTNGVFFVEVTHPLRSVPYQYNRFTPIEREMYIIGNIDMLVIGTQQSLHNGLPVLNLYNKALDII